MKIVKETPYLLCIANSSHAARAVGLLFVALSVFFFLKSDIIDPSDPVPRIIPVIMVVLGCLAIGLPTNDRMVFDKIQGKLIISSRNIFGKSQKEVLLSDIQRIELWRVSYPTSVYRLGCVTKDGGSFLLNETQGATVSAGGQMYNYRYVPERAIGEKVASFLNVPFGEGPSTHAVKALGELADKLKQMIQVKK